MKCPATLHPCRYSNCQRRGCDFGHGEHAFYRILQVISSTRKSILVCVFRITHRDIVQKLLEQKRRYSLDIRIISDMSNEVAFENKDHCRALRDLHRGGIKIRVKGQFKKEGLMHHKFSIMDKRTLIHGSANYSYNASQDNDEVVLIEQDEYTISKFTQIFEDLWSSLPALKIIDS